MNKDETQVRNYGWPFRKQDNEPKTVRDKHGYIIADCQTAEDADYILLALNLQPAPAMPVGEAGKMPGTDGFTMACFHAEDVPVGTKLYADPPQDEDLLPHLRQFMHNDGSGFVCGYDKSGVDRLVSFLRAKATPAVPDGHYCGTCEQTVDNRCGDLYCQGPR